MELEKELNILIDQYGASTVARVAASRIESGYSKITVEELVELYTSILAVLTKISELIQKAAQE